MWSSGQSPSNRFRPETQIDFLRPACAQKHRLGLCLEIQGPTCTPSGRLAGIRTHETRDSRDLAHSCDLDMRDVLKLGNEQALIGVAGSEWAQRQPFPWHAALRGVLATWDEYIQADASTEFSADRAFEQTCGRVEQDPAACSDDNSASAGRRRPGATLRASSG